MRVLHVIPAVGPHYGGPSVAIRGMSESLVRAGADVTVITTNANGPTRLEVPLEETRREHGVTFRYFGYLNLGEWKFSGAMTRWLYAHAADYDVVHVHALFSYTTIPGCRAARRAGVPYIMRPLGTLAGWSLAQHSWKKRPYYALIERSHLEHAAAIHVTSGAERDAVAALGFGSKAHIIPLGVDTSAPLASDAVRAGGPLNVLFLSRLHEKKNIPLLLEAVALREATMPGGINLVIAGSGEPAFRRALEERASALGLDARVRFAGHVEGDEKRALLQNADVFALPSNDENFGIAVAEALAVGLPVIVSDQVALAPDVAQAGAGFVVQRDAREIADALARSATREVLAPMRLAARQLAVERYSWDRVGRELMALYEGLVRSNQRKLSVDRVAEAVAGA